MRIAPGSPRSPATGWSNTPEATGHPGKRLPPDSGDFASQQPQPPGKGWRPRPAWC